MHPSSPLSRAALAVAALLAVVALLAVIVGGALGRGVDPSPAPSQTPSGLPSPAPSIPASPQPSGRPTADPSDGLHVDLVNLTRHDVSLVIDDETGTVVDARSGQPGDGMSVRWFDVKVENLDDSTLRITWVGLPRDEEIRLAIVDDDGTYALDLFQAPPPANSDAVGYDRILVIRFDTPVSAGDVNVTLQEPVVPA
jgi:hypothetical protein